MMIQSDSVQTPDARPFESVCDPALFYPSRQHREALERMIYVVRDGNMGFGLLTGEVGCGKTLVAKVLAERLGSREFETVLLRNSPAHFPDILQEVFRLMRAYGDRRPTAGADRSAAATPYDLQCRFREMAERKLIRMQRRLVVILDEAQQIDPEALLHLKGLTNLCEFDLNYLTFVLVGQPECDEAIRALPQIDQRVGLRYHLAPLDEEETGGYVDNRLARSDHWLAGRITEEAKAELFEQTQGFPREINRICKLALERAQTLGASEVDVQAIRVIARDILKHRSMAYR